MVPTELLQVLGCAHHSRNPCNRRCCWGEDKGNLTTPYGPGCFCGATHWPGWFQSGQGGEEPHVWWWTGVVLTQDLLSHGKGESHVGMACAGMSELVSAAQVLMTMQLCRGSSLHRGLQPCRAVPGHVGCVCIAAAFRSHTYRQCPMLALQYELLTFHRGPASEVFPFTPFLPDPTSLSLAGAPHCFEPPDK